MWLSSLQPQITRCLLWKKRYLRACLPLTPLPGIPRRTCHRWQKAGFAQQESGLRITQGFLHRPRSIPQNRCGRAAGCSPLHRVGMSLCRRGQCTTRLQTDMWKGDNPSCLQVTSLDPNSNTGWQHSAQSRIMCSSPCRSFKLLLTLESATHFCSYLRASARLDPGINTNGRDWHNSQWNKEDVGYLPSLRGSLWAYRMTSKVLFPLRDLFRRFSHTFPNQEYIT